MTTRLLHGLLLLLTACVSWGALPPGLPEPVWGYTNTPPTRPDPWTSDQAGYYYVDGDTGTDSGRTYGNPTAPRLTIPTALAAGAYVELHGTYTRSHASPSIIVPAGTAESPVWIMGQDADSIPTCTAGWSIAGNYWIVKWIKWDVSAAAASTRAIQVEATLTYNITNFAFISCEVQGAPNGAGRVGLRTFDKGNHFVGNFLFYDFYSHHNGDYTTNIDQDAHGMAFGAGVTNGWLLNSRLAYNSGDGIQMGDNTANPYTHHIYVGDTQSWSNKQTGFWTKGTHATIFSRNTAWGHRLSGSSSGAGFGGQYGPYDDWWIFNTSSNNVVGFHIASTSGINPGTNLYWIGNLSISNIGKAFSAWDVVDRWYVDNTSWGDGIGWYSDPAPSMDPRIYGNVIGEFTDLGSTYGTLYLPTIGANGDFSTNVVINGRFHWDDGTGDPPPTLGVDFPTFVTNTGQGDGCKTDTPTFQSGTLIPDLTDTVAKDASHEHPVYQSFEDHWGLDIRVDIRGVARPQGAGWDIGAFEAAASDAGTKSAILPGRVSVFGGKVW